jgi:hypothetical protein
MQLAMAASLARSARHTEWYGDLRELARSLRGTRGESGRLIVTGAPEDEPWHFAAHLETLAWWRDLPELTPTLVRATDIDPERRDTLLVVAEGVLPDELLERCADARRAGGTIFGLTGVDESLVDVAHEAVHLAPDRLERGRGWILPDFEAATHVFGEIATARRLRSWSRRLLG